MNQIRACAIALFVTALTICVPAVAAADKPEGSASKGAAARPAQKVPAVRPVAPPESVLEALQRDDREHPAPKKQPADIKVDGEPVEQPDEQGIGAFADPFWSWGVTKYQSGLNCSIVDAPYYETQVTSQIGYGGTPAVPKVGERFNVVLLYSHPGYACSGGFLADLYAEVEMPEGAQLAIDSTHGIGCYTTTRAAPDTWVDVTNSTWTSPNGSKGKWCQTDGSTGKFGAINLGYRMLVTGTMFQIVVPAIATKELKGAAQTPKVAEFISATESVVTTVRTVFPTVWANILGFYAPSISYPTPSSTEITPTGAKTTAYVYNHFKPGNAFIDIGTTTAYGNSTQAIPLGSYDAHTINASWPGMTPGTVYHWRARFVDENGTVTTGPDQQFTTAPASTVTRTGGTIALRAFGTVNDVERVREATDGYHFTNTAGPILPGTGCVAVTANEVRCDATGVTTLNVSTGNGNDDLTLEQNVTVPTTLLGGAGDDFIRGGGGSDNIQGGVGADTTYGGGGDDAVSYDGRSAAQPVSVTLDGIANDGGAIDASGARSDDVRGDIERITGGAGADTLVGNAWANVLRGGGGADTLRGGDGSDRLEAAADDVDTKIDCGPGTGDRVNLDATPLDPAPTGCETATRI
ncbi:MAG TPA: calcium-binding protein [Solirubrobacteraceae bacterium]|jgi:hypothetical protein